MNPTSSIITEISWEPERFLRLIKVAVDNRPGNADRDVKDADRKKAINKKKDNVENVKVKFKTGKIGFFYVAHYNSCLTMLTVLQKLEINPRYIIAAKKRIEQHT